MHLLSAATAVVGLVTVWVVVVALAGRSQAAPAERRPLREWLLADPVADVPHGAERVRDDWRRAEALERRRLLGHRPWLLPLDPAEPLPAHDRCLPPAARSGRSTRRRDR